MGPELARCVHNIYAVEIKINGGSHDKHERSGTGTGNNQKKHMVVIAGLNVGDTVYPECTFGSVRLFAQNITRFYGCLLE